MLSRVTVALLLVMTGCATSPSSPSAQQSGSEGGAPVNLAGRITTLLEDCAATEPGCAQSLPRGTGEGQKNLAADAVAICGWLAPLMSTYVGRPQQYTEQNNSYVASRANALNCIFDEGTEQETVFVSFSPPGGANDLGCYGGAVCESLDIGKGATQDRVGGVRLLTDSDWFVGVGGSGKPNKETTLPLLRELHEALGG